MCRRDGAKRSKSYLQKMADEQIAKLSLSELLELLDRVTQEIKERTEVLELQLEGFW